MNLQVVSICTGAAFFFCAILPRMIAVDLNNGSFGKISHRTSKEIWISADRRDSGGRGTQSDPFDGSAAEKFDALLNGYYGAHIQNLHIHLGRATYQTRIAPENGWHPRSGWTIEGAGMYVTTLQAAPANLSGIHSNLELIKGDFSNPVNGVTIKNLTLDCNWTALAPTADAGSGSYTVSDAYITQGSSILSSASANNNLGFDPSHFSRTVSGRGIPSNTTILRIPSTTISRISNAVELPQSIINVNSTSDFASSGTFTVVVDDGSARTISYSGKTATSFTGCTGGAGKLLANAEVTTLTQVVMSNSATATNSAASITIGGEKNVKIAGDYLGGSNNRLTRVRCINAYGSKANGQECFALGLSSFRVIGQSIDGTSDVIQGCVVEQFLGNYGSPFYLGGDFVGGHPLRDSKVVRCLARGWNTGNPNIGFNSGGINGAGLKDCEISGNTFIDCSHIYYQDTDRAEDIHIANNDAIRASGGIWFVMDGGGAWTKKSITVASNKISIQNRNGPYPNVPIWFGNAKSTNIRIANNDIYYDGSGTGKDTNVEGLRLKAINGGQLSNNRWPDNTNFTICPDVLHFQRRNNRTCSGKSIKVNKPADSSQPEDERAAR